MQDLLEDGGLLREARRSKEVTRHCLTHTLWIEQSTVNQRLKADSTNESTYNNIVESGGRSGKARVALIAGRGGRAGSDDGERMAGEAKRVTTLVLMHSSA